MNSFYEVCSNVGHSRESGPKESGRPVGDRTPALMPWLVPYGQQSMAASQHASTRSQQDIASDATRSGAAAKAAELEPSSTAAAMMYFFMRLSPLIVIASISGAFGEAAVPALRLAEAETFREAQEK